MVYNKELTAKENYLNSLNPMQAFLFGKHDKSVLHLREFLEDIASGNIDNLFNSDSELNNLYDENKSKIERLHFGADTDSVRDRVETALPIEAKAVIGNNEFLRIIDFYQSVNWYLNSLATDIILKVTLKEKLEQYEIVCSNDLERLLHPPNIIGAYYHNEHDIENAWECFGADITRRFANMILSGEITTNFCVSCRYSNKDSFTETVLHTVIENVCSKLINMERE